MFDPRIEALESAFRSYKGQPAIKYITHLSNFAWMESRNLVTKLKADLKQRDFIKDIFIAVDEDGSGTLEVDELIKALLSLCLSQDITFAKQIIYLFEESLTIKDSKADP